MDLETSEFLEIIIEECPRTTREAELNSSSYCTRRCNNRINESQHNLLRAIILIQSIEEQSELNRKFVLLKNLRKGKL